MADKCRTCAYDDAPGHLPPCCNCREMRPTYYQPAPEQPKSAVPAPAVPGSPEPEDFAFRHEGDFCTGSGCAPSAPHLNVPRKDTDDVYGFKYAMRQARAALKVATTGRALDDLPPKAIEEIQHAREAAKQGIGAATLEYRHALEVRGLLNARK